MCGVITGLFEGCRSHSQKYESYTAEITSNTFNCVIYQEQIIAILTKLAGYSIAQADIVRRVIAKSKGPEEMNRYQSQFVSGCASHSKMQEKVAIGLFNDLISFSAYCFNKSHAANYTALAVIQMWCKVHYPAEFLQGQLLWSDKDEKISALMQEARWLGVDVRPPNINESEKGYRLKNGVIHMGLGAIKGIGPKSIEAILDVEK